VSSGVGQQTQSLEFSFKDPAVSSIQIDTSFSVFSSLTTFGAEIAAFAIF
jgi:hypothetical protein